jgi:L-threonylcarbamoyladenylate synthase
VTALTPADAAALERCLAGGGVAVFPADTVYGLACAADDRGAMERIYALKGRPAVKPAAVMYFALERALAALPELLAEEVAAARALLPGPVTLLLPNRGGRHLLAGGPDPATLGLRVPGLDPAIAALADVTLPVLQSSANLSGGADARRAQDVPAAIQAGVDLVLDAGERPGVASTVIDLRGFAATGEWEIVRAGGMARTQVAAALLDATPTA